MTVAVNDKKLMMESVFRPQELEGKIYERWEKGGYFIHRLPKTRSGRASRKKPFTIILPLPNANDPMHMGHALFTIEDIMVRYHRMKGEPALWLPGGDHAGIETQFVFEKLLAKEGKSRFDFDRETLYQKLWDFADKNKNLNQNQMRRLGFSLDWTRYHYSLEPEIVERILATFRRLHADGLVYRDEKIVNFCTRCGTAFSDLEVEYVERADPLYYLKYGPFTIATTRPETKFRDTALAVNPKDKRHRVFLGKTFDVLGLLGLVKMTVVADPGVDLKFGTGMMKVTPAHDAHDFELGKKYNLPVTPIISLSGKMDFSWFLEKKNTNPKYRDRAEKYHGQGVNAARALMVEDLRAEDLLVKVDEEYFHRVGLCYKCGTVIEPMVIPQWFVKTQPLAKSAIEAVRSGRTKIVPQKRFKKMYFDWMENIHDWNISRQIVWGPRLPVWYCLACNPEIRINFLTRSKQKARGSYRELKKEYSFAEIKSGLQSLIAGKESSYQLDEGVCRKCSGSQVLQETDTFDTWFLSGQWPLTTLGFNVDNPAKSSADFKYFYPTSVLDTLWDILFFWVGRMMIFGLYLTGEVPFRVVHIHARVVDRFGKKMSKSKGNVLDPITMVEKYGADALRMALVIGVAPAGDIAISEEKIRAQRNFANKVWNIGRFIVGEFEKFAGEVPFYSKRMDRRLNRDDRQILKKTNDLIKSVTKDIESYRFGQAAEDLYQFIWHEFADKYIELSKARLQGPTPGVGRDNGGLVIRFSVIEAGNAVVTLSVLRHVFLNCLKLLHPFMPFVTEEVWGKIPRKREEMLIVSKWPKMTK